MLGISGFLCTHTVVAYHTPAALPPMADVSPPSPMSSEDTSFRNTTPNPRTASPRPMQNTVASPHSKERHLMDLLAKAAAEIRAERRKVKELLADNERLQAELREAKARRPSSQPRSDVAGKEAAELRRRNDDLAAMGAAQAQENAKLREHVKELTQRCREQQRALASGGPHPAPRSRTSSPGSYAQRQQHPSPDHHDHHERRPASRNHSAAPIVRSPPRSVRSAVPAQQHHFDAMESVRETRRSSPQRVARSSSAPKAAAARGPSPKAVKMVLTQASPNHSANSSAAVKREAVDAASQRNYNDVMLSRLRRAIAPPPTKEQLAEVVHAMVSELGAALKRHGTTLPLQKAGPCVYTLNGKKKLHLGVDSSRLVVKCGGGHVDLMEYLERNRYCIRNDA